MAIGAKNHQVERAILAIGLEQPVEAKQAGEQRANPQDRRADAPMQIGGRARSRRNRGDDGRRTARRSARRRPADAEADISEEEGDQLALPLWGGWLSLAFGKPRTGSGRARVAKLLGWTKDGSMRLHHHPALRRPSTRVEGRASLRPADLPPPVAECPAGQRGVRMNSIEGGAQCQFCRSSHRQRLMRCRNPRRQCRDAPASATRNSRSSARRGLMSARRAARRTVAHQQPGTRRAAAARRQIAERQMADAAQADPVERGIHG